MNHFINSAWDDKYIYLTSNKKSFEKLRLAVCNLSQSYLAYCKGSECSNKESLHKTMQKIF
ncbi:hypothetical protein [Helicobacter brantae]|uniref:Uncharacterized protein n=1 Tax=Helicobacter brantae TaxID=375927 RepID=A0A3D8IV62_9HELI|nr:hypothetical protein [Helicobacter brantae]RDU69138.1 hypothetical protein CQA58_07625 [Helicobacter brantae]